MTVNFIWERNCLRNFVAQPEKENGIGNKIASASAFPNKIWERETF
jgi:hypothetical protein